MIKISKKVIEKISINQKKNFDRVMSPKWNTQDQVARHFSTVNNAEVHLKELTGVIPLNKKMKILDLGCGYGYMVAVLRDLGYQAFGCDSDEKSVEIAKEVLEDNGQNPNLISVNNCVFPYKNETFDLIYISYVLVYVKYLLPFFKEIKRVLKKTGKVYLVTPNYQCGYEVNYGFFIVPFLPKWLNKIYIKARGRNEKFFGSLSLTTKRGMEEIFANNNFIFENIGIKEWKKIFDDEIYFGRSRALINFMKIARKFKLKCALSSLAKMGFYTPLIYILGKKS